MINKRLFQELFSTVMIFVFMTSFLSKNVEAVKDRYENKEVRKAEGKVAKEKKKSRKKKDSVEKKIEKLTKKIEKERKKKNSNTKKIEKWEREVEVLSAKRESMQSKSSEVLAAEANFQDKLNKEEVLSALFGRSFEKDIEKHILKIGEIIGSKKYHLSDRLVLSFMLLDKLSGDKNDKNGKGNRFYKKFLTMKKKVSQKGKKVKIAVLARTQRRLSRFLVDLNDLNTGMYAFFVDSVEKKYEGLIGEVIPSDFMSIGGLRSWMDANNVKVTGSMSSSSSLSTNYTSNPSSSSSIMSNESTNYTINPSSSSSIMSNENKVSSPASSKIVPISPIKSPSKSPAMPSLARKAPSIAKPSSLKAAVVKNK